MTPNEPMDAADAARAWVDAWTRGWLAHDPSVIAERYADDAEIRTGPFREPRRGAAGISDYATEAFADETSVECRFGEPVVAGDRAAVEYWAVIGTPRGTDETLFGVSMLRFNADGLVTEHRDVWVTREGRREAHDGWGR